MTRSRQPAVITGLALSMLAGGQALAVDYYLHPEQGDDGNDGSSAAAPWRSLARAGSVRLQAGDRILLAAGGAFAGALVLEDARGSREQPVVVSTYPDGDASPKARIDAGGAGSAVHLLNSSNVLVANLELTADGPGSGDGRPGDMRVGMLVELTHPGRYENIRLDRLDVHDVYYEPPGTLRHADETHTENGSGRFGFGIRVLNRSGDATLDGLTVSGATIARVSHTGIKIGSDRPGGVRNILVEDNRIEDPGGPGLQMSHVSGMTVRGNVVDGSGSRKDTRNWGRGSGMWTWRSEDVLIEKNAFLNANGPADSAGVHIDFGCRNVIIQYNLSANNAGGFCEILGDGFNNAYRYNVSVNDGHRIRGENGAFQQGKTLWLSGYAGRKARPRGPFNSYFYNNTIYVQRGIVARFDVSDTADGVLIANNIFYLEGGSVAVSGEQVLPDDAASSPASRVVFRNNLFLRPDSWPVATGLRDSSPVVGDPGFGFVDTLEIAAFRPANIGLVADAGIEIVPLPGDDAGLPGGLAVNHDILGNPVVGPPDLGAIEVSGPANHD